VSVTALIHQLRRDPRFMAQVTAWETLPARPGRTAPIPSELHPHLQEWLRGQGIAALYTHQHQALTHVLSHTHVALATPTASGKSLVYHLAALDSLLREPQATALYLFPTKALAQDQQAWLGRWGPIQGASPVTVALYDGDTPRHRRSRIRREARLLITNPDMLHVGILPHHTAWARFLAGLQIVVVDEMHIYRGVFGSHVANVLRRLRRLARLYGAAPRFVLTSATVANPQELAEGLVEAPVAVVDDNGAPQGERHLVFYNPPLVDPAQGIRRSSLLESQRLAARLLEAGVQTIVFGRSRLAVELLLTYLRERLGRTGREDRVQGYRGGYLPEERRAIEAGLREGTVRGVVATNALELGIDIGRLQAAVLCGYPGTLASTWQQMGRVGRGDEPSLAVLVAGPDPLDQFLVRHPEFLLGRSPEQVRIHPDNLMLLTDQVRCALAELPFAQGEALGHAPHTQEVLAWLQELGEARHHGGRWFWQGESHPARRIGLRNAGGPPVVVQLPSSPGKARTVGQVDFPSAPKLVHPGAIYIHQGETYQVERLELDERRAWVRPVEVDHYTQAGRQVTVEVLQLHGERRAGGARVGHGEVQVTEQVTDFRRIRRHTHETLGVFPLDLPPQALETTAYWLDVLPEAQVRLMRMDRWRDAPNDYGPNWPEQRARVRARAGHRCQVCGAPEPPGQEHDVHHRIPFRAFGYVPGLNQAYLEANRLENLMLVCRACHRRLEARVRTRTGMDGLAHVLLALAPLHLMCDRSDLDVARLRDTTAPGHLEGLPVASLRLYLYETVPGGLGFSQVLFEHHEILLSQAEALVATCDCRFGCPACVGPVPVPPGRDRPLLDTKALTLALIRVLRPPIPSPAP